VTDFVNIVADLEKPNKTFYSYIPNLKAVSHSLAFESQSYLREETDISRLLWSYHHYYILYILNIYIHLVVLLQNMNAKSAVFAALSIKSHKINELIGKLPYSKHTIYKVPKIMKLRKKKRSLSNL
jgi:hypothetical protein